jgi:CDP-glucose 4,6-dehydratase
MIDDKKNIFSIYKGKKVLITGDSGFKGSWLSIWLLELGAEVYGYSLPPLRERDNFVRAELARKIRHLDADIRDKDKLISYFMEIKPDIAFHLAAQPLVIASYQNPHYNFETNVMGTVNFFEAVKKCGSVKVAVNVTTDKCYRNDEKIWGYRESDPLGGDDPYSASKACSELITHSYSKSFFSMPGTCHIASARAGNVIGGGDWAENRILPDIMRAYEKKQVLVIRNPHSVRPWQHVLEPLSGYLTLAATLWNEGKNYSGAWNFGPYSYRNYSVDELVRQVKVHLPELQTQYNKSDANFHEASLLQLDITKSVNLLKWAPVLDFKSTIQMTVEGYLDELESPTNVYDKRVNQIKKYIQSR